MAVQKSERDKEIIEAGK